MCRIEWCDEGPEFFSESFRTAAKDHRCRECYRTIAKGERYSYDAGKWNGEFRSVKTCAHCVVARQWIQIVCGGWVYTEVLEELIEHWQEETELRSITLARLIAGMKQKWHEGRDPVPAIEKVRESVPSRARSAA